MAPKTKTAAAQVHGSQSGTICSKCETGSLPRGHCSNLGLCWTCAFPRSPAYFSQIAAEGLVRSQQALKDTLAEITERNEDRALLLELEAA
jgi:hypothetical protein